MSSRSCNLERALGDFLPFDLRQVGATIGWLRLDRRGRWYQPGALKVGKQSQQVGRGDDVQLPRPGRLAALRGWTNQALVESRLVDRSEQDSWRRRDPPIEAMLANRDIMR